MKIKPSELKSMLVKAHANTHYTQKEAEQIAEVYLFAEVTGRNTMGILKLLGTEPSQDIKPKYAPKIVKETAVSAVIDAGGSAGPLGAQVALDVLLEKGKKNGFAVVGSNNTLSSIGALNYYAYKIAKENLIGIVMANCPRGVAFFGGIEPVFGTNPMAYGFPTQTQPIVFDMTTSAIPFYGLIQARNQGKSLPENIAIDRDGNLTTDPVAAMDGAILPFDGSYKGSGLGLVVELLAGPTVGASSIFNDEDGNWGSFFLAFSSDLLGNVETFKQRASEVIAKLKKSKTRSGEQIHIPGHDGFEAAERILAEDGEVEVDSANLERLRKLVAE